MLFLKTVFEMIANQILDFYPKTRCVQVLRVVFKTVFEIIANQNLLCTGSSCCFQKLFLKSLQIKCWILIKKIQGYLLVVILCVLFEFVSCILRNEF